MVCIWFHLVYGLPLWFWIFIIPLIPHYYTHKLSLNRIYLVIIFVGLTMEVQALILLELKAGTS